MADMGKQRNLGRGLSALLGDTESPVVQLGNGDSSDVRMLAVDSLRPGRYQPRRNFDSEELAELAESIREKGILQPILVRPISGGDVPFEIIAGERRWRAAQLAQIHEVPAIVRRLDDGEALEWALIENLQREDLSPLEEAEGYDRLMQEFSHTQENLARSLGKSRSHVANTLRLLRLPDPVKEMLNAGELSAGHARALLNADDPVGLAKRVVSRGLNVRQTEKLTQKGSTTASRTPAPRDPNTTALEKEVSALLGLTVTIKAKGDGGSIAIAYDTLEQLDEILHRLSQGAHGHAIRPAEDPVSGSVADLLAETFAEPKGED